MWTSAQPQSRVSRQLINETITELDLNIKAGLLLKVTLIATYHIGYAPLYFKTITAIEKREEWEAKPCAQSCIICQLLLCGRFHNYCCACVCV